MEQTPRPNNRVHLQRPSANLNRPQTPPPNTGGARPKTPGTSSKKRRRKKLPLWGKILVIVGFVFGSLWFGMILGYTVIGRRPLGEAFSFSTWKHIFDLIFG